MNKKILISLSVIAAVAALAIGGTIAFFSDTETSTGNTFTAGTLDLKVDSTCHYDGMVCEGGTWVWVEETAGSSTYKELLGKPCACTWFEKDLETGNIFFNYGDVKPGDEGENTISLTAKDNDAYLCGYVQNLVKNDNGCNEPECTAEGGTWDGTACATTDPTECTTKGELQKHIFMTIWLDVSDQGSAEPCDNVWQPEELVLVNNEEIDNNKGVWPLGQLKGDVKTCLGVRWNVPGTTGNIIQSDSVTGDISFYAEQVRNNPTFTCPGLD